MILLTGVTGKTGSQAAKLLAEKNLPLRALVRNEEKAGPLRDAGIEVVIGDVTNEEDVKNALQGCEKALMILPNGKEQLELEKRFVDLAIAAGVKHLVKLSSMEACPEATGKIPRVHDDSEKYIEASGIAYTFVRPNFFMQNFLANSPTIKAQKKFFLPMGDGKAGMSDTRDIGAVMALVLSEPGHENQSYEVTGPELLSFHDAAAQFSEVLGETIEYVNVDMASYRETLRPFVSSEWHLDAVCELFEEIGEGGLEFKTDTIKSLLKRDPKSLKDFINDFKPVFSG